MTDKRQSPSADDPADSGPVNYVFERFRDEEGATYIEIRELESGIPVHSTRAAKKEITARREAAAWYVRQCKLTERG